jgi:hypothetical protein
MNFSAVFGLVLKDEEYMTYANRHNLTINSPHSRRFKAVKCHWLERMNAPATGLAFVIRPVWLAVDSEDLAVRGPIGAPSILGLMVDI